MQGFGLGPSDSKKSFRVLFLFADAVGLGPLLGSWVVDFILSVMLESNAFEWLSLSLSISRRFGIARSVQDANYSRMVCSRIGKKKERGVKSARFKSWPAVKNAGYTLDVELISGRKDVENDFSRSPTASCKFRYKSGGGDVVVERLN